MPAHHDDAPVRPAGPSSSTPTRGTNAEARVPTIYIVHEDPAELDVLEGLFRAPGTHIESFATIDDFLAHERADVPGCIVLDTRRPGRLALPMQALLLQRGIDLPVVCLTSRGDSSVVFRLLGDHEPEHTEPDRHERLADEATHRLDDRMRNVGQEPQAEAFHRKVERLTTREREVAELVVSGKLNKQIAGQLDISIETVKVHRARVMRKMVADSLADLVRHWERYGPQIA